MLLARQVQLRGQATTRPAQPVVSRLGSTSPAGRLALPVSVPPGTGGVLVRPRHRGIYRHVPADQPARIGARPAARSPPAARYRPAASGGIARTPSATAHTGLACPATARPCAPATGSRRSTAAGTRPADDPTPARAAAPTPAQPTAHRPDPHDPRQDHSSAQTRTNRLMKHDLTGLRPSPTSHVPWLGWVERAPAGSVRWHAVPRYGPPAGGGWPCGLSDRSLS